MPIAMEYFSIRERRSTSGELESVVTEWAVLIVCLS
jgi:hypothetical protein